MLLRPYVDSGLETYCSVEGGCQLGAEELRLTTRHKKHRPAGGGEANEDIDAVVTDLISQLHLKMNLTVQLESRMRDMYLPKENDIVTEMQSAGRATTSW